MQASEHFDVLVAGSSFAGLTMAIALARAATTRLRIGLIGGELPAFTVGDPRAFAISHSSRCMLSTLGLWEGLAKESQDIAEIAITDSSLHAGIRPVLLSYRNILGDGATGACIVPATAISTILSATARGEAAITLIPEAEVRGLETDSRSARLSLSNGDVLEASLAVGADGRASTLRQLAGIQSTGWNYDQVGIVAQVAHERPHFGRATQHFLPTGPFAILPLPGNRSCVTWTEATSEAERLKQLDDPAFLHELDIRFGGSLGALTLEASRAFWPLSLHLARSYIAQRLALIGDAAHTVHPIAGQGLNLAFRDVAALTEVVIDAIRLGFDAGDGEALRRYQRWRRFDAATAAFAYDGLNRLFRPDWPPVRTAREIGLALVDRFPLLKRQLVAEAAGTTGELPKLLRGEPV